MGGKANLIHAPLHADSQTERDMLMSVRSVKEVMDHAQSADIALLGIGSVMGEDATYYAAHPIEQEDRARLYQSGVRAEFLGNLIDAKGQICANDLNSKLVGLPLRTADEIPVRIGVVSGLEKVEPICAVLNGNHVTTLVIDDVTAKGVLKSFI